MKLAYDRGLYVVVNMHGDGYKSVGGAWLICDASSQTAIKDKYQKVWQQVASELGGFGGRLVFESMNENFDGQYGNPTQPCYSNINAYNQIFVDTVRKTGGNNATRLLIVTGYATDFEKTADKLYVLPTDTVPNRLLISVHYYTPWQFVGLSEDAGWGKMIPTWGT